MSGNKEKILETLGSVMPDLTELEQEKLLSFGEGIAFKTAELKKKEKSAKRKSRAKAG